MSSSEASGRAPEKERRIKAAEFAWELVTQLAALRESRGLSQADLAKLIGTRQQAISRLENPRYDRQSLRTLRQVAEVLDAFIDVVVVPEEKAAVYLDTRFQPVLDEEPSYRWLDALEGFARATDTCVTRLSKRGFRDEWCRALMKENQPSATDWRTVAFPAAKKSVLPRERVA